MLDSIQTYTVDGYDFIGMSQSWKRMCLDVPDSDRVRFPGYETAFLDTNIDGQDCLIQAWKGNCIEYPGMPGGIGGEVGIYKREPDRELPAHFTYPQVFPPIIQQLAEKLMDELLHAALDGLDYKTQIWWPYPALNAEIAMRFTNPLRGGALFFEAVPTEPAGGYWMSRWMRYDSYNEYSHGGPCPAPTDYDMAFTVGTAAFAWNSGGGLVRTS